MADTKVIRQSRGVQQNNRDDFKVDYNQPEQHVDFPIIAFLFFLLIDIVDIILTLTGVGALVWPIITLAVVFPIQILYVNYREKKYSGSEGTAFSLDFKDIKEARTRLNEIQKINKEAAELLKAGDRIGAASKLGNAKRILPPQFKWLGIIVEKISVLQMFPLNSIIIILSYYDNKESVRAIKEGIKVMAGKVNFKVTRRMGSNQ